MPLRAPMLDRRLLAGADPHRDSALEWRGKRLCSLRRRERLAAALEHVLAQAERRGDGSLSAAAPVAREDVLGARTPLLYVARRLRSDAPVDPQGILLLRKLLSDPASALNSQAGPEPLRAALRQVSTALIPR
jgi:hypothetical protein